MHTHIRTNTNLYIRNMYIHVKCIYIQVCLCVFLYVHVCVLIHKLLLENTTIFAGLFGKSCSLTMLVYNESSLVEQTGRFLRFIQHRYRMCVSVSVSCGRGGNSLRITRVREGGGQGGGLPHPSA